MEPEAEIHVLNSRLQKYFMRVQQISEARDIAEHELSTVRERMEKEVASVRSRLTNELLTARQELEMEIDQRTRLQVLEQEQYQELQQLRTQVKDLIDYKPLSEQMKMDLEKERALSKSAKEMLEKCNTELSSYKRRINTMDKESRKQAAILKDTQSELERLRLENQEFLSGRDAAIEALRKEFMEKSRKDLAVWKKGTDTRIAQATKEAKDHYNVVFESKKVELTTLKTEFDVMKKEKDKLYAQVEEMLNVREELSAKISTLETSYGADRRTWHETKTMLEQAITTLRTDSARKETDYNALMDCKLSLDAEISTYRMILDQEESRVGVVKTPKRRQSGRKKRASTSTKKAKTYNSDVHICQLDIQNDQIMIENLGTKEIDFTGWTITGQSEQKSFTYPSFLLPPNAKTMVQCGKKGKGKAGEMQDGVAVFSTRKYLWNSNGDAATLSNADGKIIHRISNGLDEPEVEEEEEDYSDSELMEPLRNINDTQDNNCCIM